NGYLVNTDSELTDFGCNFRLKAEAVLLNRDFFQNVPTKAFVACLDVSKVQIRCHIRKHGQKPVSCRVPIIKNPVRAGANKSRAINDISYAAEDGSDDQIILARAVFEVGILNDDNRCGEIT